MKKLSLLFIALSFIFACKNKNEFTISGKIDHPGELKKVFLYQNDAIIDSAFLNENNEFKFTRISPEADFFNVAIGEQYVLLIAQNGDEIELNVDASKQDGSYELSGSEESEKIRDFGLITAKYTSIFNSIQEEFVAKLSKDSTLQDSLRKVLTPRFESNMEAYSKETLAFAKENENRLAGFYAMGTLNQEKYEQELLGYAEKIKGKFPKNTAINQFLKRMEAIKPVSIGQLAPGFEMANTEGKLVKLSDFRGSYVLVDFWASWCGPCRAENPNLVNTFAKYRSKNFTILGVSLDDDRADWLKAIKDDQLRWMQVSELKKWQSPIVDLYKIEGIPASFLLDPQGKIIAKNLRGNALDLFLAKTLKP